MFNSKPVKVVVGIFAAYGAFKASMTAITMIRKIRFNHLSPEKKFEFILRRPGIKEVVYEARHSTEENIIRPFIMERMEAGCSDLEIINEYNDYILEAGPLFLPNILNAAGVDKDEDVSYFTTRFMSMIFPDIRDYIPQVS